MSGRYERRTWAADPNLYAPPRHRRPCSYDAFVPDPITGFEPLLTGSVAGIVSDAEARIVAVNSEAQPALAPLARFLLRTESIASSKVEGMQMDVRSLARAEARIELGRTVGTEAVEILANIDAMQLSVEEAAGGDLSVDQLARVHEALLERSSAPTLAGRIRDDQNWIGGNDYNPCGADYVPPPPEAVTSLLEDLVAFSNGDDLPPVVQAALAHAQFELIHPFADGNGRTGRALVQIILRRRGCAPRYVPPISVVLAAEKERYIRGLNLYRGGDVAGWIEIFAAAAARSADLASSYLDAVRSLQDEWRGRLSDAVAPRSDAAAWQLIDALPGHLVLSAPVAAAVTGRSKPVVDNAIAQLVQARVLVPLTESRRNRSWEADGLLDLLADLEQGQPPP